MAGEFYDVLFDPSKQNYSEETLPLDEIIFEAIQTAQLEMHVCMPCVVTSVSPTSGYVSVQPTLQTRYKTNSKATDIPIIQDVPVQIPCGQDWWIKAPVAVGDVGILLFAERSIDNWAVTSGQTTLDPQDSRMFDLSDAIFLPGIRTSVNPLPASGTDLVVHNGLAEVSLQKAGTVTLKNQLTSLGSILSSLDSALTTFATGLTPLTLIPQAAALVVQLAVIQLEIDSLLE